MKEIVQLLLFLIIALITLVFFGPLVIMVDIIGKIEVEHIKIDLTHLSRSSRIVVGVLGLGVWLAVYVPLGWMLMKNPGPLPISDIPAPTAMAAPTPGETPVDQIFSPPPETLAIPTLSPGDRLADQMESVADWENYSDKKGSVISTRIALGLAGNAIEIGYDLEKDGWVGVVKEMEFSKLEGTDKIRFFYSGYGLPNTIEVKLHKGDVIFSNYWSGITDTNGEWKMLEASYSQFVCWEGTGCIKGEKLDASQVDKIDFAISNKAGNLPGIGVIRIDNVQALK